MDDSTAWKEFLANWPKDLKKTGIVISLQGETVSFRSYMMNPNMVLFERHNPDALGARSVLLTYSQIAAIKFTDVVKTPTFQAVGFIGELSSR